jgi:hypothetical protein
MTTSYGVAAAESRASASWPLRALVSSKRGSLKMNDKQAAIDGSSSTVSIFRGVPANGLGRPAFIGCTYAFPSGEEPAEGGQIFDRSLWRPARNQVIATARAQQIFQNVSIFCCLNRGPPGFVANKFDLCFGKKPQRMLPAGGYLFRERAVSGIKKRRAFPGRKSHA